MRDLGAEGAATDSDDEARLEQAYAPRSYSDAIGQDWTPGDAKLLVVPKKNKKGKGKGKGKGKKQVLFST